MSTESDAGSGTPMTRRTLLRRGGTAAAGAAATSVVAHESGTGPIGTGYAQDVGGAMCDVASVGGFGLLGYATYHETDVCRKPDRSAEQEEADWENWVDFYNRARQINTHDQSQLEQARRDANGMANLARRDAILGIYNEAVGGNSESDADAAARDAVNSAFSETITGVLNHFTARMVEFEGDVQLVQGSNFNTDPSNVLEAGIRIKPGDSLEWRSPTFEIDQANNVTTNDIFPSSSEYSSLDVDLPSGETVLITGKDSVSSDSDTVNSSLAATMFTPWSGHQTVGIYEDPTSNGDISNNPDSWKAGFAAKTRIREPDPSQYDAVDESEVDSSDFDGHLQYLDVEAFHDVIQEIETIRQNVLEEVEQLVDIHFQAAQDGNISLPEMTASQGLLEAARNADSFREIALTFRTMGWATADTATVIQFEDGEGNMREADAKLAWARQDQPDPLDVGVAHDASQLPGTMYIAYNYTDENGETAATYGTLVGEFTITETEDGSPEVGFEHRGVVDTSMSPTDVQDEFRETNDAEQDAEEARQDINVTSGGFSLFGDGGLGGAAGSLIATVMIAVAALFGWNVISDDS